MEIETEIGARSSRLLQMLQGMLRDFLHPGFDDPGQERRFQQARDRWLASRLLRIVVLVACVFLAFVPLDRLYAPGHAGELGIVRAGAAVVVVLLGLLVRRIAGSGATKSLIVIIAAAVYAEVFLTRVVVGQGSEYDFTAQMMLVQVGVWFIGALTFPAAAAVNIVALAAWLVLEFQVINLPVQSLTESVVLFGALNVISGFAAFHIEGLFRRSFAVNEVLEQQKQEYRARAMRDGLTGLWNRQAMDELIVAACAGGLTGTVLMIDLDDFKPVNDRHGHRAGDEALVAAARRIQSVVRPGDAVGRIGGDEFLVLARDLPGEAGAQELSERIRGQIEAPMRVSLHADSSTVEVRVRGSIGFCVFQGAAVPVSEIMRQADLRMYQDKTRRKTGASVAVP